MTLKKQKETVVELMQFAQKQSDQGLTQLILRLANNYKLLDLPEVKSFIQEMVKKELQKVKSTG